MALTTLTRSPRRAPDLVVCMAPEGSATVVTLLGKADLTTLPLVTDTLDRVIGDHRGPVIMELAEIHFIDSAMVRALSQASRALGERGRQLTIRSPSPAAVRVLELFGLSQLIVPGRNDGQ